MARLIRSCFSLLALAHERKQHRSRGRWHHLIITITIIVPVISIPYSFSSNYPLDMDRFKVLLNQLPKEIIRAKGMLTRSGGAAPLLFNYVCGRFDFRDLPELKNPVAT
jgi:G3E family GTPase